MDIRRIFLNALAAISTKESIVLQELKLPCPDGTILAAQRWTSTALDTMPSSPRTNHTILCLHGWLDNCRSFYQLAPALAAADYDVVALDLPGHGWSSHKSLDAPPMVQAEMAFYVSEAIQALNKDKSQNITLIGHSLGAGIASLYTASFPEQIQQLVLLDGAGFLARDVKDTAVHVRNHIKRRSQSLQLQKPPRIYPDLELAIQTRLQSAKTMPGTQSLSYQSSKELVERATRSLPNGFQFRHDSRYVWPSIQYMTWEQNEGIFQAVSSTDTCLLLADNGWPFPPHHMERTIELLQPNMFESLPGSHYFHADPDNADAVAKKILEFLSREKN